jgi:hypothetical protein
MLCNVVFGLRQVIFEGFVCRNIGADISVLHVDYSVNCNSSGHTALYVICIVLVFLWPIGVPAGLLFSMYKVRNASGCL